MHSWQCAAVGAAFLCLSTQAFAAYGIFSHGYGIKSASAGGVAAAIGEDSSALAANPATLLDLNSRFDLSVDAYDVSVHGSVRDNDAAPDSRARSNARYFFIPQGGFAWRVSPDLAMGATVFSAGLGTDYHDSPYARFGGDARAGLRLTQSVLSSGLAYEAAPGQRLGVSISLGYQMLKVDGFGFLAPLSAAPDRVSDRGTEGHWGYGGQVGWVSKWTRTFSTGVSYRTKTNFARYERYSGLLPGGQLDMPEAIIAGLAFSPVDPLTLAFDFQRVYFSGQAAIGNPVARLQSQPMGADHGPGFGWRDQDIYKFGLIWKLDSRWTARAGYSRANRPVQASETFFGMVAPGMQRQHITAGFTRLGDNAWELTGYGALMPRSSRSGENSIPLEFGGGEASVDHQQVIIGLGIGRSF